MKTILITGVASGIGKETCKYFLENNYKVIGLDIKESFKHDNLVGFIVDITNKEKLLDIKDYLFEKNIMLDAIVNIAGIHKMASLVESDYESLKKLIDINLLGTMLVNNIFHSLLVKKGRIVITSSEVATLDPMPFNGLYSVSKAALDCYSQALRQELNLLNQYVITIRPGAIETPLSLNSLVDTEKLACETKLFEKQAKNFLALTKKFMGKPIKPIKVAKIIYKAVDKKKVRLFYKTKRNPGLVLLNILPKRLQCFIIRALLK